MNLQSQTQIPMGINGAPPTMGANGTPMAVQDNILVKKAEDAKENPAELLAYMGLSWAGLWGISAVANNQLRNPYEKTFLSKIGKIGDSASSSVVNGKFGNTAVSVKNSIKTFFDNLSNKSSFARSFRNPTSPRSKFVISSANGLTQQVADESITLIEEAIKNGKKLSDFGLDDATFKKIKATPNEAAKDLQKALETVSKNEPTAFVKKGKFLKRKCYFGEYANKLKVLTKDGAKSAIGKGLSKSTIHVLEGVTNGMAGSPLFILMQAYIVANAFQLAKNAPKGEKVSTFMENMCQDLAFFLTFPLSIRLMHSAGGLAHIGMGKDLASARLRAKEMKSFIDNTNIAAKNGTLTKLQRQEANLKVKGMLNGLSDNEIADVIKNSKSVDGKINLAMAKKGLKGNLKWYQRIFQRIGRTISMNLRSIMPISKTGKNAWLKNIPNKLGRFFKCIPSTTLRLWLAMFAISPFFGKIGAKVSDSIFGRPTKSVLDPEEPKKEESKKPVALTEAEENKFVDLIKQQNVPLEQVDLLLSQTNLSDEGKAKIKAKLASSTPSSVVNQQNATTSNLSASTQTPSATQPASSQNIFANSIVDDPNRTYVPSSTVTLDMSAIKKKEDETNKLIDDLDANISNIESQIKNI